MFGSISCIIVINIYIIKDFVTYSTKQKLYIFLLLVFITIILWIRRQITYTYKQMLKEDTIKQLESELNEEKEKNEKITHELETIATINHKYSTRISALELYVKQMNDAYSAEMSDELANITHLVDNLSEEYTEEISQKFKQAEILPKTNILGIDNIINFLKLEANKENISFDMKINCNVNDIIEKLIPQNKLETLIGDHIKDAIKAIKCSNNKSWKISLIFDKTKEGYEICFKDTGIEFQIETLLNLGLKKTTTHKDTGGSGIGFMTTFETLRECKASLIIEEYKSDNKGYTKAIIIRFDGRNEYKIHSYRKEEIQKQNTDNRIIIQ